MYVIMDLEWFEAKKYHYCPTQVAALRVDDHWNSVAAFNERICPHEGVAVPWGHVAFSGASREAFVHAYSAHAVFDRLTAWLKPDDVLCWWDDKPAAKLKLLLKAILKQSLPNKTCILKPYFTACVNDGKALNGNPHTLARKRGICVPKPEHCAMNDAVAVQKLMRGVKIPTQVLQEPVPARKNPAKLKETAFLFLYDEASKLLHLPGSDCAAALPNPKGMATIKGCLSNKYRPCPDCCNDTWKKELRDYNQELVRQRRCGYFYFENSKVFHRGSCHSILSATRNFSSTVYYDTCINAGRTPCKICKPVPGLFTVKPSREEEPASWMRKYERRALDRYTQAIRERSAADTENMNDVQRKDMLTLTDTSCAFWASQGYQTFHLRSCRKLSGLTNLKGFQTFQHAMHAGYQPCRECRPTKKHNLEISMPIDSRERKEETLEEILAFCTRWEIAHTYREPILHIRTAASEWTLNVTMHPVVIDHKPNGCDDFHRQHRMFMSLLDAVMYIAKHDNAKKRSIEGMPAGIRQKERP